MSSSDVAFEAAELAQAAGGPSLPATASCRPRQAGNGLYHPRFRFYKLQAAGAHSVGVAEPRNTRQHRRFFWLPLHHFFVTQWNALYRSHLFSYFLVLRHVRPHRFCMIGQPSPFPGRRREWRHEDASWHCNSLPHFHQNARLNLLVSTDASC